MSANFLSDRGEFRGKAAWHNAGNVFPMDAEIELVDAASKHWGDIKIVKAKVFSPIAFPGEGGSIDVRPVEMKGAFNIVRMPIPEDPEPLYLGTVTKGWETKNPLWYAERLNGLSQKYPLETLGTLGKGERVFFSLRDRPIVISNGSGYTEDLHSHYVFDLSLKPGVSSRAFTTRTRPVCQNTLTQGWGNASHKISIPHSMDATEAYEWMIAVSEWAQREAEFETEVLSAFMRIPLNVADDNFIAILERIYRGPAVPGRVERHRAMSPAQRAALSEDMREKIETDERRFVIGKERAETLRANVVELAQKFNDEFPAVANTVYAAYNAVTELATHREAYGRENVAESILSGSRADEIGRGFSEFQKYAASFSN